MDRHETNPVLIGLVAVVATFYPAVGFGGRNSLPGIDPNTVLRLDPNALSWTLGDWQARRAEDIYAKEGAEIVPWTREGVLPGPDNAAILYYQAFLLRPQPDDVTLLRINAVLAGAAPDRTVRAYLGNCRAMIHTLGVAAQIPQCTWGVRYLDTAGFSEASLMGQIRQSALVLGLDARTLAADGHHEAALTRGLMMRRLAWHTGDNTMLAYLVSLSIDGLAQRQMQYVLGLVPPDVNLLQWLRGQLATVRGTPPSMEKAMQADFELALECTRNNPALLAWIRQELAKTAGNQQAKDKTLAMTDEDILALARETCQRVLNAVFQTMDSKMPYDQKCAQIGSQVDSFAHDYGSNPAAWSLMPSGSAGVAVERYSLSVRNVAAYNALKTAVEVYLARAQTGQLPQALPAYAPKDPFSGQAFEYEITASGFVLRCRAKDLYENKVLQYEFSVSPASQTRP